MFSFACKVAIYTWGVSASDALQQVHSLANKDVLYAAGAGCEWRPRLLGRVVLCTVLAATGLWTLYRLYLVVACQDYLIEVLRKC